MKRKQQGITFLSFVIVLAVVGFFLYIGMRLFPVYTEFYSANNDIKKTLQAPGAKKKGIQEIRNEIRPRFQISYVDTVNPDKDIKMITVGNVKKVQLKYEVRKPLLYNLDFVAMFDRTYDLNAQAAIE